MTSVKPFKSSAGAADAAGVAAPTNSEVVILTDAEVDAMDAVAGGHVFFTPVYRGMHFGRNWERLEFGYPQIFNFVIEQDWHKECGVIPCLGPYTRRNE